MGAVSAVKCCTKFGLVVEGEAFVVVYFLEQVSAGVIVVRYFLFFSVQPVPVEFAAFVIVDILESLVFVHVCQDFPFFVGDVLNVEFSETIGSLVLLDVFLLH
jgi:hypothetical protein